MKIMKQLLALAMAVIMCLSLVACGGGNTSSAPAAEKGSMEEIKVNIWDNNQRAGLQEIADKWTEKSGIKVTIEVVDWDNYWTLLEAGASGGEMPDVFWMHSNTVQMYMENDILLKLLLLALFRAEVCDQIVSCLRICHIGLGCPAQTVVSGPTLFLLTGAVAVAVGIGHHGPCVVSSILSSVESIDHPGALSDHGSLAGLEQGLGTGFSDHSLRSTNGQQLSDHFHTGLTFGRTDGSSLVVIGDQLAAISVNQIVPAVLVVGGIDTEAINIAVGTLGDCLGSLIHVLISPVVVGVSNAILIENSLVVQQGDGIVVLGQGVDTTVVTGVQVHNAFVIVSGIGSCIGSDVVIQAELGVTMGGMYGVSEDFANAFPGMDVSAFVKVEEEGSLFFRPYTRNTTVWEDAIQQTGAFLDAWQNPEDAQLMETACDNAQRIIEEAIAAE